jgi:hypothetical protein
MTPTPHVAQKSIPLEHKRHAQALGRTDTHHRYTPWHGQQMKNQWYRPVSLRTSGHPDHPHWAGASRGEDQRPDWTNWKILRCGSPETLRLSWKHATRRDTL